MPPVLQSKLAGIEGSKQRAIRTDTRLALAHQLHTYPKFLDTLLRVNMCQEKPLCAQVTPVWGECCGKVRRAVTACREACMVGIDMLPSHAERHGQAILLSELQSLHLGANR